MWEDGVISFTMAVRKLTECVVCGEKQYYIDHRDVINSKWKILAWIVPSGEPRCVCDKCVYSSIYVIKKKSKE